MMDRMSDITEQHMVLLFSNWTERHSIPYPPEHTKLQNSRRLNPPYPLKPQPPPPPPPVQALKPCPTTLDIETLKSPKPTKRHVYEAILRRRPAIGESPKAYRIERA